VDTLALDRASVRTKDQDGHLHVEQNPISKAVVNPYLGNEIPDWQALGLDPDRVYQLYRDPEELKKGAATFDGKPLLLIHRPQMASDHEREVVIGTVKNPAFDTPYLKADLVIWDGQGINLIESGEQKELSSGYRYDVDMTPGTADGVPYDGVMRNIRGNHVAIVRDGRAGSDVVVGDSNPFITKETEPMAKVILSQKAALTKGALAVYLAPKMAQDAKLDFNSILGGITAKNFGAQKSVLADRIRAATKDKLAQDANLDDLTALLDTLDKTPDGAPEDPANMTVKDESDPNPVPPAQAVDEVDREAVKSFLKEKLGPEDHAKLCEMLGQKPAGATDEEAKPNPELKPAGDKPEMVTKQAMDAALAAAGEAATAKTMAKLNAIREAERFVRPWVGDLAVAMDSADAVYAHALKTVGIKTEGVHPSAFRTLLEMAPKPGSAPAGRRPAIAQDGAGGGATFKQIFPGAQTVRRVA
jgi:uncharacterized protein